MLENLLYSVNAILPIFILVLIGAGLKKWGVVNDSFVEAADKIVFKLGLPVMLFCEVSRSRISDNLDVKLIVFLLISVTAAFLTVSVISAVFVRDKTKRGALTQGICRSNFAILGVPLAVNMFGEAGGAAIAIAMPFVILMFNSYSVVILSVFSGREESCFSGKTLVSILKNVVTNPLIIGVVLALPFMLLEVSLPTAADKTLGYISNITTPLALFSLGANFKTDSLKGRVGYAVIGAVGKTVIIPAAALTAAALVGLRGTSLGVVLICFGAPTAVSSYIMAKKMGNDHELAAQILLLSTFMCVITIFVGIFILKSLALI